MNDKRKKYLKKWREDNKEHIQNYKREYAKNHDSSFKKLQNKCEQLQQENKQLKEKVNKLEILIENLKLGVTLNQEQEDLLDEILFRESRE